MPQIIGMGRRSLTRSMTGRLRPTRADTWLSKSAHAPPVIGRAVRFSRHRLIRPSTIGARQINAPATHATITHGRTSAAVNFHRGSCGAATSWAAGAGASVGAAGRNSRISPLPAAGQFGTASGAATAVGDSACGASTFCSTFIQPGSTAQPGRATDNTGRTSKLAIANSQTRCRPAAEVFRRIASATAPATPSTTNPLTEASNNTASQCAADCSTHAQANMVSDVVMIVSPSSRPGEYAAPAG